MTFSQERLETENKTMKSKTPQTPASEMPGKHPSFVLTIELTEGEAHIFKTMAAIKTAWTIGQKKPLKPITNEQVARHAVMMWCFSHDPLSGVDRMVELLAPEVIARDQWLAGRPKNSLPPELSKLNLL